MRLPFPRALLLKDPVLVNRWTHLVEHLKATPRLPEFLSLQSVAFDWALVVRRRKWQSSLLMLNKLPDDDERSVLDMTAGGRSVLVTTEYAISLTHPCVLREDLPVYFKRSACGGIEMDEENKDPKIDFWGRYQAIKTTTQFDPTVQELDEMAEFLRHSEARVLTIRKKEK